MKTQKQFAIRRDLERGTEYYNFHTNSWTTGEYSFNNRNDVVLMEITEDPNGSYWSWFSYEDHAKNEFCYTAPAECLVEICFPYGIKTAEKYGQGKLMRVSVKELEKIPREQTLLKNHISLKEEAIEC